MDKMQPIPTRLDTLRDFLRNVPSPTSFHESVELLAKAFAPGVADNPAAGIEGNDEAFYGVKALTELYGRDYADVLANRSFRFPMTDHQGGDGEEPTDLRNLVDRFAVVAYEQTARGVAKVPAKVVLRVGLEEEVSTVLQPPKKGAKAFELVRVRAGLMNRRQALLLANHLNRFKRSPSRNLPLTWRAVRGPDVADSARHWLDALGGGDLLFRRLGGSIPTWGLKEATRDCLAVYNCESAATWHDKQVFAYARPRMVLPTRYHVSYLPAVPPGSLPDGHALQVRRTELCPQAFAMAKAYLEAGFINDSGMTATVDASTLWGDDWDLPRVYSSDVAPAYSYSTGLELGEALAVVRYLRSTGNGRRVRIHVLGLGGAFGEGASGTREWMEAFDYACHEFGLADGLEREYIAEATFSAYDGEGALRLGCLEG